MERLTIRSKNSDMVWFKDAENGNAHLEPCEMTAHHNRMALDECIDVISISGFDYEVIGNKFDNPELLEVQE